MVEKVFSLYVHDLDRYFSCLQPRMDKREGIEGKGKERKQQQIQKTANKHKKENETSRGIRELRTSKDSEVCNSQVVCLMRDVKSSKVNH